MKIAFVTCERLPQGTDDDRIVAEMLGAQVHAWSDPHVDWRPYDAVILRSTWDYFHRPSEFAAWLDRMEAQKVRLHNPVSVVRWNMDKRYLRELETLPTRRLTDRESVRPVLEREGWDEAVVKPAISGGAFRTFRVKRGEELPPHEGDVLVQPFAKEIVEHGEYSVVCFDGAISHTVLKTPKAGDFRTQPDHGAGRVRVEPPAAVREAALKITAKHPTLYARVDGFVRDGRFLLMELELIEPALYFDGDRAAAKRFAAAIRRVAEK